jgi:hypothetical protein
VAISISVGQGIAAGAFGETHFVNVARERGLGYLEAAAAQLAAQLVLVGDQRVGYEVTDRVVSLKLHCTLLDRPFGVSG